MGICDVMVDSRTGDSKAFELNYEMGIKILKMHSTYGDCNELLQAFDLRYDQVFMQSLEQ